MSRRTLEDVARAAGVRLATAEGTTFRDDTGKYISYSIDSVYDHSYTSEMCIIGRSSGYRPDYAKLARSYCRPGATQAQLAELLEMSHELVNKQPARRAAAVEAARGVRCQEG